MVFFENIFSRTVLKIVRYIKNDQKNIFKKYLEIEKGHF